jgi:galactitol-specific phosphotransferase system IIB component
LILILVLGGTFAFAQKSLPGEPLFVIKKITEKSRAVFVAENEKPKVQLELANKRLEDLAKIAQKNDVRKLAPAIDEFQANVSEAAKNLAKTKTVGKDIIVQTQELEKNKEKIEKTLATQIGTEELENVYKGLAEQQIKDLENSSLTESQTKILAEAKEYFQAGDYSNALIKTIEASQTK